LEPSIGAEQQTEALKFLVHFVGDVHQPLHCGFTTDYGGNSLKGYYESTKTNLHAVWDDGIIETRITNNYNGDDNAWANALISQLANTSQPTVQSWITCKSSDPYNACSEDWGNESVTLACSNAYVNVDGSKIKNNFNLADPYYQNNIGVVESQIIKGGVRLAAVLNNMFASTSPSSFLP